MLTIHIHQDRVSIWSGMSLSSIAFKILLGLHFILSKITGYRRACDSWRFLLYLIQTNRSTYTAWTIHGLLCYTLLKHRQSCLTLFIGNINARISSWLRQLIIVPWSLLHWILHWCLSCVLYCVIIICSFCLAFLPCWLIRCLFLHIENSWRSWGRSSPRLLRKMTDTSCLTEISGRH